MFSFGFTCSWFFYFNIFFEILVLYIFIFPFEFFLVPVPVSFNFSFSILCFHLSFVFCSFSFLIYASKMFFEIFWSGHQFFPV